MQTPKKAVSSIERSCLLCSIEVTEPKERLAVFGKGKVNLKVAMEEIFDISLETGQTLFICKAKCYSKLVRWDKLKAQQRQLKEEFQRECNVRQKRMKSCSLSPSANMSGKGKRLQTSPAQSSRSLYSDKGQDYQPILLCPTMSLLELFIPCLLR